MDGLDFSVLSDDQLLTLLREAMAEAVRRGAATAAAAQAAYLDERERVRIAQEAAAREAAILRARERERVAREAAEEVRRRAAAERAAADRRAEAEAEARREADRKSAARRAAEEAAAKLAAEREWLRRAAELVGRDPSGICLLHAITPKGSRVLINPNQDRYSREHLADWNADTKSIATARALVGRKPDLIALCAEFRAACWPREVCLRGADHEWDPEERIHESA